MHLILSERGSGVGKDMGELQGGDGGHKTAFFHTKSSVLLMCVHCTNINGSLH